MSDNKTKTDVLHDLMPKHLNTENNPNWKALISAIGEADQNTANLVSEVRKQFFVKTASRPYLDRLAANSKIARPRLVGMDDPSFRDYIPVLSYKPKQVKLIIDQLLDIFFFKESTTAFITSQNFQPFTFENNWELEYSVDAQKSERIKFTTADFTNISAATANEIVAAINRQTKYSYATAYYDSITKNTFIRIFTNTVGSKGSIQLAGGRANVGLHFNGFLDNAGTGTNTEWTITKIGDQVTMQHTAGSAPNLSEIQTGDIVISSLPNNEGSFVITNVDLANNSLIFKNLFGTPGTYIQTSANDTKFIRPNKYVAYLNPRRAMTWETSPSEIVVEMPTSPPVVKRSLKGSLHVNGAFSQMSNRNSDTSMTVNDASQFPNEGTFIIEPVTEIQSRILTSTENIVVSKKFNNRLISNLQVYSYTSRTVLATTGDVVAGASQITNLASVVGLAIGQEVAMQGIPPYAKITSLSGNIANISTPATESLSGAPVSFLGNVITGIDPALPALAGLNEFTLTSLVRSGDIVTGTTSAPHGYIAGEPVAISGSSGVVTLVTTGDTTNGSNTISNLASTAGVAPDQLISGAGIPAGAKVVTVAPTSVTISAVATASNVGTAITFAETLNGVFPLLTASGTTFTFNLVGSNGSASVAGTSRVERIGLSNSGSKIIVHEAVSNQVSRIIGPYIWDLAAPFVLSSDTTNTLDNIQAGKIIRLLNVDPNTISDAGGFVIFDYGLDSQEGPVRYLYKPTNTTIALDPSYIFKHSHPTGAGVTAIRTKGPHQMSGRGDEYAPYVTDPSEARVILQDLIRSVKSAGIFVNFLIRYPEQLYATLDVYSSGVDPG
jgi:hypothetical protein